MGGFTEHQFAEKRLPTLDELNAVAPDTPVFILHLYDRALLNVRSPAPPVIALVGLLGILIGEQLPPLAKRLAGAPADRDAASPAIASPADRGRRGA